MGVRVRGVIVVGMTVATGADDLARAQNRASIVALGIAATRSTSGELFAHTFGEGQATAGTGIAVGSAEAVGAVFGRRHLRAQEIRMIFDLRRFRAPGLGERR